MRHKSANQFLYLSSFAYFRRFPIGRRPDMRMYEKKERFTGGLLKE